MPRASIRQFPDPVLRKISEPIRKIDRKIDALVERLIDTMHKQPGGIGIAAPQIGILKQLAVVDVSSKLPGSRMLILINPKIISFDKELISREGCMSLPDYTANVRRADRIKVRWQDLNLKFCELDTSGLEA